MNLARFGLAIDPRPAQTGAKATIAAANSIKAPVEEVGRKVRDASGKFVKLGSDGSKAGSDVSRGMRGAANDTNRAAKAAKDAGGAFGAMAANVAKVAAAAAAAYVAFKAVGAGFDYVSSAIDKAAQMEGFVNRWALVLGGFDAAKAKMAELATFANNTPFDLPGVTKAAFALESLKNTGLETMAGLKLVGDAAGKAQQPIEEVAERISRLIGNLKRGAGGGDEARALGEWKVFSSELVGKIMDQGQDAGNFPALLEDIKKALGGANGMMELAATSWTGMVSTMADAWDELKRQIGQPIMEGLKPLIGDITSLLNNMAEEAKKIAPEIQRLVLYIPAAWRVLRTDGGLKLALTAAWEAFADLMRRTWDASYNYIAAVFKKVVYNFKTDMADPAFWKGIADSFINAIKQAVEQISPFMADTVAFWTGGTAKAEQQLQQEKLRLEQTRLINAQVTNESLKRGGAPLPAPAGGYEVDLPGGSAYTPPLIDGPPPDPSWVMEEPVVTESMKKLGGLFGSTLDGLYAQIDEIKKKNEDLVRKDGGPDAGLFPKAEIVRDEDTKKDALLPGTDMAYTDATAEAKRIEEQNRTAEEAHQAELTRLNAMKEARLLSEDTYQRAITKSKETATAASAAQAEAAQAAMEKQQSGVQKLLASWGNLKQQIDQASVGILQSIEGNITDAITSMIEGTKSASQAFADMAKGIVNSIIQIITKLIVQYALYAAMGMLTGGTTMAFGSFATGALSAGVKHEGGSVEGGAQRNVPAAIFAGARRYHEGGVIGANEVPIIAEKGESVLTKDQAADIKARLGEQTQTAASGGGQTIHIANFTDPREMDAHLMANPTTIINVISRNAPAIRRALKI